MAHTMNTDGKIVIEGVTQDGRKFRPSDWAERMSGVLSTFGRDHRIHYSPLVQPTTINGVKCIVVDPTLEKSHPEMFSHILSFARNNNLTIHRGDEQKKAAGAE